MAWIKRNLFFFIGGLVSLGLLGAAVYYDYTSWSRNADKLAKLVEIYGTLNDLNSAVKSPGDKKNNKTQQAHDQEGQLKDWLQTAQGYFQPIASIPTSTASDPVTSASFAAALRRTVDAMQRESTNANVVLPPNYEFSFQAQSTLMQFSPGSLGLLAVQLGEVRTITEILYGAGINELDGIQRTHVSDDDAGGPQSDYIAESAITNNFGIITPYVVNFKCFSPEIAQVFAAFAASSHGFVIKGVNVQPAGNGGGEMAGAQPPVNGMGLREPAMPGPAPATAGVPGKGGLVTVLKEQLLRVSMEIDIIKLQPKN